MSNIHELKQLFHYQDSLKDLKRPLSNKEVLRFYQWLDEITIHIGDGKISNLSLQKPLFILSSLYTHFSENKKMIEDYFHTHPEFIKKVMTSSYNSMRYLERQTLTNMIFSFGLLNIHPSKDWIIRMEEDSLSKMNTFDEADYKKSIIGYMHITNTHSKMWIENWYEQSGEFLYKLDVHSLGAIAESLTRVDRPPSKKWINHFEEAVVLEIKNASIKELATFLKLYATFDKYNFDWIKFIQQKCIRKIEDETRAENIAKLFYSLGVLGEFLENQLLHKCIESFLNLQQHWKLKDLGVFLYGCALLDIDLKSDFPELLMAFQEFFKHNTIKTSLPISACYGLMLANRYYNLIKDTHLSMVVDDTKEIENYLKHNSHPSTSQTQTQIYNMYKDHQNVEEEVWIPEIFTYADLCKTDKKSIIEIDGSHHFQNGRLNTKSVLKTKILEKVGYEVLRIPVHI